MLQVKNLVFNDSGRLIGLSGNYTRTVFSVTTDKVLYWAELGIEYIGG